jgi:pyruvate/2-oxoglutarate dehydrogenase complex dihydrolipoamide acyltransferase (E2) component
MRREVRVPKWGLTIEHVRIASWLKEVGDEVQKGDPLCEVETDKAESEIEAPEAGRVVELVASVDDECAVGDVVAILETEAAA